MIRRAVTACTSGGGLAPGAQNVPPPGHDHRLNRSKLIFNHALDNTCCLGLCQAKYQTCVKRKAANYENHADS